MKMIWVGPLAACVAATAGCAPTPQATYEVQKEIMIGSPAAYRYQVDHCVARLRPAPFRSMRLIRLAQTPPDRGVTPVCERIMAGVRDGKLSYESYLKLFNEQDSPDVLQVLQRP